MNSHPSAAVLIRRLPATLLLGAALLQLPARAAEGNSAAPSPVLPSVAAGQSRGSSAGTLGSNAAPVATLSPIVTEVLKMAEAEVTTPVLKTYVECSPLAYQITDTDVIALKKAKVADEVVTVLLQRSADIRAAYYSAKKEATAKAAAPRAVAGGLDPESYDYFQHYYLHTRTLASASQNIPIYGYTGFGPAYGYGSPYGLGGPYWNRWGMGYRPGFYR